jgi:serine/threonine-protein kinase
MPDSSLPQSQGQHRWADRAAHLPRIVTDLVDAALDLPVEKRQDFLASAYSADPAVRAGVEHFVSACERAEDSVGFLHGVASDFAKPILSDLAAHADFCATELPEGLERALAGRYQLQRQVGRGGMATVYLAHDLRVGRPIALKALKPDLALALGHERFLREIRTVANLTHPHIVPLLETGEAAGTVYFTMPFVAGESLREALDRQPQMPLDEALRIAAEVADALDCAHRHNIVHRDIKPDNILLEEGHAVVADFGVARAIATAGGEELEEKLTATGVTFGTPAYMSPEQAGGERAIDGRSDIYSLGSVLYEMLAGEPPYRASSLPALITKILVFPIPSLKIDRPSLPEAVDRLVQRCLAKAPADRFQTAAELRDALRATARGAYAYATNAASAEETGNPFGDQLPPEDIDRIEAGDGAGAPSRILVDSRDRSQPARKVISTVIAGLLLVTTAVVAWTWRQRAGLAPSSDVIAVLPFRVTAPDSSLNYLREGIVDLLNARLTGEGVPRAVDSRTTLSAWNRATGDRGDLSTTESLALAARLGARQALLGDLVLTSAGITASARLLRVHDAQVLSEYSILGAGNELELIDRLIGRLLALNAGEAAARLSGFSDSLHAVKAYLAGMQSYRGGRYADAFGEFTKALEIDSLFAPAALWRTSASELSGSANSIQDAGQRAWALRGRMNRGDRALLEANWAIGPRFPEPSTTRELISAAERAVRVNPDRPEAWHRWGGLLLVYGAYASIPRSREQAGAALDSAIALDSTYASALEFRLMTALEQRDSAGIRRAGRLYSAAVPDADEVALNRWMVARALNDFAILSETEALLRRDPQPTLRWLVARTVVEGRSLADAERVMIERNANVPPSPSARVGHLAALLRVAAIRGSVDRANALADSIDLTQLDHPGNIITLALVDSGYDSGAQRAAVYLRSLADTVQDPTRWGLESGAVCYSELWRVSRGDTAGTRRAIARIRDIVRDFQPAPFPRVGRLDVCPLLLEAALERPFRRSVPAPALDRLEALMKDGPGLELPANLANIMVARWREEQGDNRSALAAVRRRLGGMQHPQFTLVEPAYLRDEGRLAALVGDTAGAVRAYTYYLAIRDQPDPGPMTREVEQVRKHLAMLTGDTPVHPPALRGK